MGNRWKRIAALLLSSAMCMTMMPSPAFAASESENPATEAGVEAVTEVQQEAQADDMAVLADNSDEIPIDENTFQDSVFRSYVEENFDTDQSGTLSEEEIAAVTKIEIGNRQVFPDVSTLCYTLQGIEYFTELEELDCYGNMLTDLDLNNNTKLKIVDCSSNVNRVSGTEYGEKMMYLEIRNCPDLEELYCYNNSLGFLDLSGNPALTVLNCENNELSSLDVSNCENLTYLACSNNADLESLDVSGLTHLQTLISFIERDGGILPDDQGLVSLTLGYLPELTRLDCHNDRLEELDVSGCPNLASLRCSRNQLTQLDLGNQQNLTYIDVSDQQRKVTALRSPDWRVVSLEGLVSPENYGNITLLEGADRLEGDYIVAPNTDEYKYVIDYTYATGNVDMDVHLYIQDTYKIDISDADVTIPNCTYDGSEQTPEVTVTNGDRTLTKGTDYRVSYSDNINAGTATVTIRGRGFYNGSISKTFEIAKADVKDAATVSAASTNLTYNAARQTASIVVTAANGTKLKEGVDYVLEGQTAKAAGTHKAMIAGIGNYAGTTSVNYKIAKASQKLTAKVKKTGTKKYTVKASKLKKNSRTFKLAVSRKGNMKVRYSCKSSKIKVNKNGKVTLKKGLKKGTYKIKVTTGATKNYKANKNPKYITVKVK